MPIMNDIETRNKGGFWTRTFPSSQQTRSGIAGRELTTWLRLGPGSPAIPSQLYAIAE